MHSGGENRSRLGREHASKAFTPMSPHPPERRLVEDGRIVVDFFVWLV